MKLRILFLTVALLAGGFCANAQSADNWADNEVLRCALDSADANRDGILSDEEADALTVLNLTLYRIHVFLVKSYEDLKRFPHLKKVWLGESKLRTVDLSYNQELEYVCIQSDNLKTLILPVGCTPQIAFPTHPGKVTIKRVVGPNDPHAFWHQ